jgi:hypothetical protein
MAKNSKKPKPTPPKAAKPLPFTAALVSIAGGDGMPPEPNWGHYYGDVADQARAHGHWSEICSSLRDAGGLAVSNGHAILRLITMRMEYDTSAQDVASRGVVIAATPKRYAHTNPHFRAMRQLDETIRQLEAELGIAPVRRGRIGKVVRKITKPRAADAYLGKPANQ